MIWFHILVVLVFIILGARLGGVGIGLMGAAGVVEVCCVLGGGGGVGGRSLEWIGPDPARSPRSKSRAPWTTLSTSPKCC